jgi:primosomal protein N' (replication factor Y)
VLGPVPAVLPVAGLGHREGVRALLRVPRAHGAALAAALRAAQGVRSTRKAADPVRVQVDPVEIG